MQAAKKRKSFNSEEAAARLRTAGLRPTRQRLSLVRLLGPEQRHVTAEMLRDEAAKAGIEVSLATVYNTLHQFTGAGLLREVVVEAGRSYFDTNTSAHHHFFCEDDGSLIDIPGNAIEVARVPEAPEGFAMDRVDVVVRVRRA
jgi:Fur family iron response transcriptional regulator